MEVQLVQPHVTVLEHLNKVKNALVVDFSIREIQRSDLGDQRSKNLN